MAVSPSAGARFRRALQANSPLQIVGAINAYSAMLAERAGHQALYLSGAGVANASYGLPDLGMTSLNDVLTDVDRITSACDLPLLVDIDTGWGGAFNIARTIKAMEKAGAAAVHLEDQVAQKRCGHRPNKAIVSLDEMVDRVKAAVDARVDGDFVIMARTDAIAVEGIDAAIARALACIEAGADAIFPEAITNLDDYRRFSAAVKVPILANITEFGATPLFNARELAEAGAAMVLYPLSAFRAMSRAAEQVYGSILRNGDQKAEVDSMQTRAQLYEVLGYHAYEEKLDALFSVGAGPALGAASEVGAGHAVGAGPAREPGQ
jgi:methylisocitrate lyase